MMLSLLILTFITLFFVQAQTKTATNAKGNSVKEMNALNVSSNINEWDADMAIMFYAPWCKYCKQLLPSMEAIAGLVEDNKNLVIGKFNCESPAENKKVCDSLNVDKYPSVFFVGYGNFNQAPKKNPIFGKPKYPSVVRYVGDLYPEAIYGWIGMLSTISSWKRRYADVIGFFTGQNRYVTKLESMQKQLQQMERKANLFGEELEKYKANELFDSLADNGDPFPLLHEMQPDEVVYLFCGFC
jgi:thiol-disulfide isomerase/thioredoxin